MWACEVRLEIGDCVAEAGPVLGGYVGWGLEGCGGFEEFGCCVYAGLVSLESVARCGEVGEERTVWGIRRCRGGISLGCRRCCYLVSVSGFGGVGHKDVQQGRVT